MKCPNETYVLTKVTMFKPFINQNNLIFQKSPLLLILFFSFFLNAQDWESIPVPPDPGSGNVWELQESVSDDFNYNFAPVNQIANFGNDKWYNFYHNGWDGPGTTYWQYDHVSVDGNDLVFKSSRNSSTVKLGVPGVNAGCVTSNGKVKYPVYAETSISVADIVLASDFWLLSPDDTQEIDVIECYGGSEQGNEFFSQFIHLSHHSFIRDPFTDYQPRDFSSWWGRSDVSVWGKYCWNNGDRKYIRIGVHWISPFHFEYYVEGELVRVLFDKAFASKKEGVWVYTYPTMTDGNLDFDPNGFQTVVEYATESTYSLQTLQEASNVSSVSVIDPFNFQGGNGFTKEMDIIVNVESQDWHVLAGRTPTDADLNDPAKNTMKVDWIRVYKPVSEDGDVDNRTRAITFDNRSDFIPQGETEPMVEFGADMSITVSYSTGIINGVEEDLSYIATQVRQIDASGNIVATSAFEAVVPDSASNTNTVTYDYTIPTEFDDPAVSVIPATSDLPAGHKLTLVIFMAVDNASSFADATDTIVIEEDLGLSIADFDDKKWIMYPNPSNDFLTLKGDFESWIVYSVRGKILSEGNGEIIDVSNLSNGMYYVAFQGKHKQIVKFIKE